MDDAWRFQRDFDLLMQELEANNALRQNKNRKEIRAKLERSINGLATERGWTIEQREDYRERLLAQVFSDLEISN